MWDVDANKYWKERDKSSSKTKMVGLAVGGIFVIIVVCFVLGYGPFSHGESPSTSSLNKANSRPSKLSKEHKMVKARSVCRTKCHKDVKRMCADICMAHVHTKPKPKAHSACKDTCIVTGNNICSLQTQANPKKKECSPDGFTFCRKKCRAYEKHAGRQFLVGACNHACKDAPPKVCNSIIKCIAQETA